MIKNAKYNRVVFFKPLTFTIELSFQKCDKNLINKPNIIYFKEVLKWDIIIMWRWIIEKKNDVFLGWDNDTYYQL
jgi:hypothetical protein